MNHITVPAHGSEGSFVRRVQHDPGIAVALLDALRRIAAHGGPNDHPQNIIASVRQIAASAIAKAEASE